MAYSLNELFWAAGEGNYKRVDKLINLKPADQNIDELMYSQTSLYNSVEGGMPNSFSAESYKCAVSLIEAEANPYRECYSKDLNRPSNPFFAVIYRGDLALARLMIMKYPNYTHIREFLTKKSDQSEYPSRSVLETLLARDIYEVSKGKPNRHFAEIIAATASDAQEIIALEEIAKRYKNSGDLIKAARAYEAIVVIYSRQASLEMSLPYYKPREFWVTSINTFEKDVNPDAYRLILRDYYLTKQRSYLLKLYACYAQIEEHLQNNSATATQADKVYHAYVLGRLIEIGGALPLKDKLILNTFAQREIALLDTMAEKPRASAIPEGPEGIVFSDRASVEVTLPETDDESVGLTTGRPKRGSNPMSTVLTWMGFGVSDAAAATAEEKYSKDN